MEMTSEALIGYLTKMATSVNVAANMKFQGVGFAIPIPRETPENIKGLGDNWLVSVGWNFERCHVGPYEYYVLFPLGRQK